MAFNTLEFMLFLGVLVILYYLVPRKAKVPLLLAGSYLFYAYNSLPMTLFLLLSTAFTYFFGRKIGSAREEKKKRWLTGGVVALVAVLAFYKYTNFLLGMVDGVLKDAGVTLEMPGVKLFVPLGISFIIFTAISYLVDVSRGKTEPENRLMHFALYIAFFPKVAQGPITKSSDIIPQFDAEHRFSWEQFRTGFLQVLYGLFMKMVIADRASVAVNTVYGALGAYSGATVVLATVLFAFQIYFDFAGYSLIAIGASRMLGIGVKDNFRQPYMATSVGEFWRRWHISLNRWLTDYVYIPLGGSRCTAARRDLNTLATFGVSGLWHGADWGFVIWGLVNGLYIVVEKRIQTFVGSCFREGETRPTPGRAGRFLRRALTFLLVTFSWIFFRAQSLATSMKALNRIFLHFDFGGFWNWMLQCFRKEEPVYLGLSLVSWIVLAVSLLAAWIVDLRAQKGDVTVEKVANAALPIRWLVFLMLLFAVILFGMYGYGYSADAFIYAQF